jgi:His-Xaa-Ser system radical SAM maturase HxsB
MLPLFNEPSHFAKPKPYRFLPFRFIDLDDQRLLVNLVGEHELISRDTFDSLLNGLLSPDSSAYLNLKAKHFLADTDSHTPVQLLATKLRTKYSHLAGFTKLHIFVVTLRCDHSCHYCQVSRVTATRSKYDMSRESADRAIDLVFRAPSRFLKVEFQGGEPLLNFDLIRYVVEEITRRNQERVEGVQKAFRFVIATNLSAVSDEILKFAETHRIDFSTSVDGPAYIHNANRPRPENDAYERTIKGIVRVRAALGHDAVAAVMTTTKLSLEHPEEIVDEYVALGFSHIFLRPISPYGFAIKSARRTGYERSAFLEFYTRAFKRIVELNVAGTPIIEVYAQILLTKMLTPYATSYVDLQSPAGAGIGAVVYNYDGDVYASDEARMLAEMGDKTFRLGSLHTNSYEEIFGGQKLRDLVAASINEAMPACADCAYQPFCGADPIENHATQGDVIGHRATSDFCARNIGIISHLLRLYHGADPYARDLFHAWTQGTSPEQLIPPMSLTA